MSIFDDIKETVENFFKEKTTKYNKSPKWKEYKLGATLSHCDICYDRNNKIYEAYYDEPELPEHHGCKCYLEWLKSLGVGKATELGINGADFYLNIMGVCQSII